MSRLGKARSAPAILGWAAAYAALALALTWPLGAHPTDHLPTGRNATSLPASAGAWALWWVSDRLARGGIGLWDAPIFFPARDAFGYSETTIPLGIAAAPLLWLGASPALAYNLVIGGSLVVNGLAARGLCRTLGASELSAGLCGAMLVGTALVLGWIAVLPLVPLFGWLWVVDRTIRLGRDPSASNAALLGASAALTWLLSLQYGMFALLVAPALLVAVPLDRRRLGALGGAALLAALLLAPVLVPQQRILSAREMVRSEERAERGALSPSDWASPPIPARLPIPGPTAKGAGLYPGTILAALVAVGLYLRRRDRETLALALAAALAALWSVLPGVEIGGFVPYAWLRETLPGLARIRESRRAAALAVALLPVLAAPALDRIRWKPLAVAAVALWLVNQWPRPMRLQPTPTAEGNAALIEALRSQVPDDGAVLFLPYEPEGEPTPEVDRMILQAAHGRRMANGYSSYYPPSYWELRRSFRAGPRPLAWAGLVEAGVTHVVAPPGFVPRRAPLTELRRGEDFVLYALDRPRTSPGP